MNNSLPTNPSALTSIRQKLYGVSRLRYQWSSIACLVCISLLVPVLTACIGTTHPLRVGTTAGLVSDNLYLAEKLKYYQSEDIRLIDYPTADDQLRAFRNRQVDVTAVPLSDALILAQTNPDLKGFLVLSSSYGEDALVANKNIASLQDLRGQHIGIEASSRSRLMLAQALEQAKLSNQEVQVVSIPLGEQIEAFEQGQVAAVATHEPVRSSLLATGGHYVYPETENDSAMFNVLLVNGKQIKSQRQRLVELSQGCLRASDYASHHQREVSEHLAKRHQLSPELMKQVSQTLHSFDLAKNQQLLEPDDPELRRQVKLIGRQLQQQQLLNRFSKPRLAWDDGIVNQLKG